MIRNTDPLTPEVRKLQHEMSGMYGGMDDLREQQERNSQSIQSLLNSRANIPASPVSNLLWNGELGHSVHTWNDATTGDMSPASENEEAAWWFSHNAPAPSKTFTDADVGVVSDTLQFSTPHTFTTGCAVDLTTTGVLPTGLAAGTAYFVRYNGTTSIQLASTLANAFSGPLVDITGASGGGTHTIQQKLISTTAPTSTTNNELKSSTHATYDARYSRWDPVNGWAELAGTMSVDALMPANLVDATTPLARIGLIAARKNKYIELPEDCLFAAGIWDNTSGQRKFLTSDVGFTAELAGAAGTTERRFRMLITSDRGYSILSNEVTIANAPSDAQFSSTRNIIMSWPQQAGQLQVDIYEYLPATAAYRLLTQVSAATSYIHQGSFLSTEAGYPTSTDTNELNATYFTRTGEVADLAINGVSARWDTVIFPIAVPSDYNKGNTTDRQWVRIWLTKAPNLFIEGCTTDGSGNITAPVAVFEAEYDGLYDAETFYARIYDENGTEIMNSPVHERISGTVIRLEEGVPAGSNRQLRIIGGGLHGVIIDKIHLGYQTNTSYTHNPLDVRTLQPRAAPTSSTQGGPGVGDGGGPSDGDDGGGIRCIAGDMPVKMHLGNWKRIKTTQPGQRWAAAGLVPNILIKLKEGVGNVRWVRAANGIELVCTDTERFIVDSLDSKGTPLYQLRVGDPVLTEIDNRIEKSPIAEISAYLGQEMVYTPTLDNNHLFIAGEWKQSVWRRVMSRVLRRKRVMGGFVLHNWKITPLNDG